MVLILKETTVEILFLFMPIHLFCNGFSTVVLYLQPINYSVLVMKTPYFICYQWKSCSCSLCSICQAFYNTFCKWTPWELQWKFHYQACSGSPVIHIAGSLWILICSSSTFSRSRLILTLSSTSRRHTCWRELGSVTSITACSSTLLSR